MAGSFSTRSVFGGLDHDLRSIAHMLGTTTREIEGQGLDASIADLVRGRRRARTGTQSTLEAARTASETVACPIGLALAQAAGCDPQAILMLGEFDLRVQVTYDDWPAPLSFRIADRDGVTGPIGPGILWRVENDGTRPMIEIDPERSGTPHTLLAAIATADVGLPLSTFVSHPILDAHDLRVGAHRHVGRGHHVLHVANSPPPQPIRDIHPDKATTRPATAEVETMMDAYCDGDCLVLAFALHWMCGWPVLAVSERGGEDHLHFAARGPDGLAWDARGPRSFERAAEDYAGDPVWEEVDAHRFVATDARIDEDAITTACTDAALLFGAALERHVVRRPRA